MTIVPKLAGVINTVKTAFTALNATMLDNPIALIIAAIAALVTAFIYLWNTNEDFRQFWIDLWENVTQVSVACWEAVSTSLKNSWDAIWDTVSTAWNGIKDFFSGLWDGIKNVFTAAVNVVSSFLATAWNASDAVGSVAEAIRSVLHFSVPDEGPLTDYESWMPDFIGGLADGIEKSRGMIEKALSGITSDMTFSPKVLAAQGISSGAVSASNGDLLTGISNALNTALAAGGSAGDIVIPVYIGGDMIDEIVVTAQQRMNLRSGGR